jgi:hypothetical protein
MRYAVAVALISVALPVFAQEPLPPSPAPPTAAPRRFDVYLGYETIRGVGENAQYIVPRGNTMAVSFGVNLTPSVGLVLDEIRFGAASGTQGSDVRYSFLAGPRFRLGGSRRVVPYADVLMGAVRTGVQHAPGETPVTGTMFQMGVGAGLDVPVRDWLVLRPIQFGVRRVFDSQVPDTTVSLKAGVVLRFGGAVHR